MVVDDEKLIGELCVAMLNAEGFETLFFSNIKDALNKLENTQVDFIISDINMPEGDGIEFKTKLNENKNLTPFLFMTGFSSLSPEVLKGLNVLGVIKKPFNFNNLNFYLENSFNK